MRLQRAEFEILQQLRSIPEFTRRHQDIHLLLSGGKDSVALFQLLLRLHACPNSWSGVRFSLTVHHFNHKRRGAESDSEEAHCADLARQSGVPMKIWRWTGEMNENLQQGENFHALARDWRYRTVSAYAADNCEWSEDRNWWICTAHHRRDHAETILHNITRGCGKSGLSGILACAPLQRRLRPLLWLPVEVCDDYIAHKALPHVNDSSNGNLDYTRNRLRHIVMKELESLNPKAVEHIWSLSSDFAIDTNPSASAADRDCAEFNPEHAFVTLEQVQSKEDLHRFIAQHVPEQLHQLTRKQLSNIFTHIKKCSRTQKIHRKYIFALSGAFDLILTHKHLQITATHEVFSDSTTSVR
jgi:tRNA(Ile)-lysidine synthase